MHEFGLMNDLVRKMQKIAVENGATKIESVSIWLGALTDITPDHFREHFVDGVAGTIAENAELIIEFSSKIEHPDAQQILIKSIDVS